MVGPFLDFENNDLAVRAVGRIFDAQFDVLKELGIPEGLKIAPQSLFVVGIAFAAEDARLESIAADSAVADEFDALDHCRSLAARGLLRILRLGVVAAVVLCGISEKETGARSRGADAPAKRFLCAKAGELDAANNNRNAASQMTRNAETPNGKQTLL